MTILEVINRVDALEHNTATQEEKIRYLSLLDTMIYYDVIRTHPGWERIAFTPYDPDTPLDTQLLVQQPYDEMYVYYLQGQIHYFNGEYERYNAAMKMYQSIFLSFAANYDRSHKAGPGHFVYF